VKNLIGFAHSKLVFVPRMEALVNAIAAWIPAGKALDMGCGNGMIAAQVMERRPDVEIVGIDVLVRPDAVIPVQAYDGKTLPYADRSFDAVMLIDVLHHIDDRAASLAECLRVARGEVIIKDHFYANAVEHLILRGLDWVGNAPHGVRLPYNYFTRRDWQTTLKSIGAREIERRESVTGLYPQPFQSVIGRNIQFMARLTHDDTNA
jgi:ubiquinone/menaquinone biosynthesis C-methylase UbiE